MDIQKLYKEWKSDPNAGEISAIIEPQTGRAIDILHIDRVTVQRDAADSAVITFDKGEKTFVLHCRQISDMTFTSESVKADGIGICLRESGNVVNLLIYNDTYTLSVDFYSGSIGLADGTWQRTFGNA